MAARSCSSLSFGAYSNSCPLSRWCHPTISSSVTPFYSCPQSFPASGPFTMKRLFELGGQIIGASALASVLPRNIQDWFLLGLISLISCCPRDTQKSSPTPQFERINSSALSLLYVSTFTSVHDYWENHTLNYMNFCWQSDVSAFSYAILVSHSFFSKEQVSFNFMVTVTVHSDFAAQGKKKNLSLFPLFHHLFAMKWWNQMPWSSFFLNVEF